MKLLMTLVSIAASIGIPGPERAPLIEGALDQPMQFKIEDVPVVEAFAALTAETGVDIAVAPDVLDLLPYGSDTRMSVTLERLSLREGLGQFLLPLAMTFEVTSDGLCVLPKPELLRIGRRATWAELDGLAFVRETDWTTAARNREALRPRIQFRLKVEDPWSLLSAAAARVGAGLGDQVLTLACSALGWTWFPEDDKIVVLSMEDQVRRQLDDVVSLRSTHRPLVEVLQQLARTAHVPIRHEPGVLASLPPQTRQNFSLLVERITVGEVLEQIAAAAGLGYRIDHDTVVFYHPGAVAEQPAETGPTPSPARDPYVAKLALPAKPGEVQVEILIRESELSADAIQARRKLVQKADEILRLQFPPETGN
ncbi:MAG: hypothetical protein V2A79_12300 [Planctomycetota bacterium]